MSCVILFKGPEAYVSGKYGWTVLTGQCVTVDHGHAQHLVEKFPDWFELVNENGDEVLAEGNVKMGEPFDGLPVDEEDEAEEDEEPEMDATVATIETVEPMDEDVS